MEYIDIINNQDQVIGQASREEIYNKKFMHRIVHVYVFNNKGELALQRRGASCDYCPLHFAASAAGHVMSGETYLQAAQRELKEELGIDAPLEFLDKRHYDENERGNLKFIAIFRANYDGDFAIDKNEVDSIQWLSLDHIKKMRLTNELFMPQLSYVLDKVLIS